jgi:hypothetical protein
LRAASEIIKRVIPFINMLMPTSAPIAHEDLKDQCLQISSPKIEVPIPSNRIHPDSMDLRASNNQKNP